MQTTAIKNQGRTIEIKIMAPNMEENVLENIRRESIEHKISQAGSISER
jgi:hypothetical protein